MTQKNTEKNTKKDQQKGTTKLTITADNVYVSGELVAKGTTLDVAANQVDFLLKAGVAEEAKA